MVSRIDPRGAFLNPGLEGQAIMDEASFARAWQTSTIGNARELAKAFPEFMSPQQIKEASTIFYGNEDEQVNLLRCALRSAKVSLERRLLFMETFASAIVGSLELEAILQEDCRSLQERVELSYLRADLVKERIRALLITCSREEGFDQTVLAKLLGIALRMDANLQYPRWDRRDTTREREELAQWVEEVFLSFRHEVDEHLMTLLSKTFYSFIKSEKDGGPVSKAIWKRMGSFEITDKEPLLEILDTGENYFSLEFFERDEELWGKEGHAGDRLYALLGGRLQNCLKSFQKEVFPALKKEFLWEDPEIGRAHV